MIPSGISIGQPAHFVTPTLGAIFKYCYAFGFLLAGWMIYRIGVRRGYAVSIGG